jgi:hypothetical protein
MIRILLVLCLLFTNSLRATEFNQAMGVGLQYSGLVGYQISTKNDAHRFRGSVGLLGIGAGYDYFLSPKWSLGGTYTQTFRTIYSVNINYYDNTPIKGLNFGLDIGKMPNEGASGDGFTRIKGRSSKNIIFLSVGYAF